jgi:uncharacterized protein (DUF427 family)
MSAQVTGGRRAAQLIAAGYRVWDEPCPRRLRVVFENQVLADSVRARLLFETGLPTRYYLPRLDVRLDLLRPSPTVTRCPYKGVAGHYSAEVDGVKFSDVAWSYPAPRPEVAKIENLICFYDERVDQLLVDGS